MADPNPERLPTGISRDKYGFRARVEVYPLPERERRFSPDTPISAMVRWRDETQAELRLTRRESGVQQRTRPGRHTLAAAVARYPEVWTNQDRWTRPTRLRHLACWALAFGDRDLAGVAGPEIERQLLAWQRTGLPLTEDQIEARKTRRVRAIKLPLSDATLCKVRMALVSLYDLCGEGVRFPEVRTFHVDYSQEPPRAIDPEVMIKTLAELPPGLGRAFATFIAYTGCRESQISRIDPEAEINRQTRAVFFKAAKRGISGWKPMMQPAWEALMTLEAAGRLNIPDAEVSKVSPWLNRMWQAALREAATKHGFPMPPRNCRTLYGMRHAFGTAAFDETGTLDATQHALGHTGPTMARRYAKGAVDPVTARAYEAVARRYGTKMAAPPAPVTPLRPRLVRRKEGR